MKISIHIIGLIFGLIIVAQGAFLFFFPQWFYRTGTLEQEARNRKYFKITGAFAMSIGVAMVARELLRWL